MHVKGEIVFPNNLRELRRRKQLTQVRLGQLLDPPVSESTISKMESGERRLTNLQLANLAAVLGCRAEEIPVIPTRDPSSDVNRWQNAQQDAVLRSIESGAAATGYVLAQLRKKSGKTMQQVADAIGMTLSVYHRVELASRIIQTDEIDAVAKLYGLTTAKLIGMFERRTRDNLHELERGTAPERLLPRTPRSLLKDDAKWGQLGALERYAIRRSIRNVGPPRRPAALPVYGRITSDRNGGGKFVIDRNVMAEQIPYDALLAFDDESFLVRNFSQRLGFWLKPGALARVEPRMPVAMGDLCFVLRRGGNADAAIVIGEGAGALKFKMYNPEEELMVDDPSVVEVLRIRMFILP